MGERYTIIRSRNFNHADRNIFTLGTCHECTSSGVFQRLIVANIQLNLGVGKKTSKAISPPMIKPMRAPITLIIVVFFA